MKTIALVAASLLALPVLTSARQPPVLRGLDPVALCGGEEVPGREDLTAEHGRYTYRFATEQNRARFLSDAARYSIQWGGGCGRMGPLSGRGDTDRWTVYDGRIYIFASDGCRSGFLADPGTYGVTLPGNLEATAAELRQGDAWIGKAAARHGIQASAAMRTSVEYHAATTSGDWKGTSFLSISPRGDIERARHWVPGDADRLTQATFWSVGSTEADQAYTVEVRGRGIPNKTQFETTDETVFELVSAAERDDLRRLAHREPLTLLLAHRRDGFVAAHRGAGKVGETDCVDIEVAYQGLTTTLHLDAADGKVLATSWRGRLGSGQTRDILETMTGWTTERGLLVPTTRNVFIDGTPVPSAAVHWHRVEVKVKGTF